MKQGRAPTTGQATPFLRAGQTSWGVRKPKLQLDAVGEQKSSTGVAHLAWVSDPGLFQVAR